jgi:hypothetical protein
LISYIVYNKIIIKYAIKKIEGVFVVLLPTNLAIT